MEPAEEAKEPVFADVGGFARLDDLDEVSQGISLRTGRGLSCCGARGGQVAGLAKGLGEGAWIKLEGAGEGIVRLLVVE